VGLEKEKKDLIDLAKQKELVLKKKISTIGNLVHDSVPVNNNEV
jgi:seryl-tRNA synthetase